MSTETNTTPPPDESLLQDLKELVLDHPAATILSIIAVIAVIYSDLSFVAQVHTLHTNICTVVAQAGKGNAAQHQYWTDAAGRATLRAAHENGTLRSIDLVSAKNDAAIARAYAPNSFKFPGC